MEVGFTVASGAGGNGVSGLMPTLKALTIDPGIFYVGDAVGTVIGAIGHRQPRSTLSIYQGDGSFEIDEDGNLLVGEEPTETGEVSVTIEETLPEAANSPRRTTLFLTILTPVLPSLDFSFPRNSQYIGQVI
ncbi:hypothetical protein [Rhizobium leguminosarum]|uniref:hypothetical protein n=1 Tax=Rhizobium leguminosarum TaxID=384 RepID=UPI00103B330C|nr:hypothetical protein [Rhizobium leguminosarum]TCA02761.1 hypothetical protein E0H63_17905 [Rhizobium leguminosarum bv. viciae]